MARELYDFGPFTLDRAGRRLLRDGMPVALTPKAFEALAVLVANHGQRLSREELVRQIWPDTTVGEDNLKQCIAVLRSALDDSSRQPSYIATLPGYGYSFVAEVRTRPNPPSAEVPPESRPTGGKRWAALAVVALLLLATFLLARASVRRRMSGKNGVQTIAVLPFQPPTPQPDDEYLGIGLTDAIITKLGQARGLQVRTIVEVSPYSGQNIDVGKAGRELAVGAMVAGTIQRQGEVVRIQARLLDTTTGKTLWSDEMESSVEDMFLLEDKVVAKVEGVLTPDFHPNQTGSPNSFSADPIARQDYMKGRFFWSKRTKDGFTTAIDFFQQAIERDPKYAEAYAGIADSYGLLGFYGYLPPGESYPKAKLAAQQALAINPNLPEAHVSLLNQETDYGWDWQSAEKEFRTAIELNPNDADAYQSHAYLLLALSRPDAAVREVNQALELDPVSPGINVTLAWVYYLGHDYARSLQQCRRTLELFPDFVVALQVSALDLSQQNEWAQAQQALARAQTLSPENPITSLLLAEVLAAEERSHGRNQGHDEKMRAHLEHLLHEHQTNLALVYYVAGAYAVLGRNEEAFAALDQAYAARSNWLIYLKLDPRFESLHEDPRYLALLRKVGL